MTTEVSKRELLGGRTLSAGLGLGALALFAQTQRASADTPFTNFPFTAVGAPTSRTMPARLSDFINVLDWGADPTGVSDSRAGIQAAINSKVSNNSAAIGTIYFPRGTYLIGSPGIALPPGFIGGTPRGVNGFVIRGDGASSTVLKGNFNGFILDTACNPAQSAGNTGGYLIEDITVINGNMGPLTSGAIRFAGLAGGAVKRCEVSGMVGITTEDAPGSNQSSDQFCTFENIHFAGGPAAGAIGIVLHGDSLSLIGCDASGLGTGVTLSGSGHSIISCHFEVNTTAILVGIYGDLATAGFLADGTIASTAFEGNGTGIDIYGAFSGMIQGVVFHGEGPIIIGGVPNQTSAYGLRCRDDKVVNCQLFNLATQGVFTVAGLSFGGTTGTQVNGVNLVQGIHAEIIGGGGVACSFPTGVAQAAAGWQFIGGNVRPAWTFFNLPNSSNANDGDQFDIVDVPSSPTFGQVISSGGGSNHARVRWNAAQSRWTVCGV
jgi:hypothetical protein